MELQIRTTEEASINLSQPQAVERIDDLIIIGTNALAHQLGHPSREAVMTSKSMSTMLVGPGPVQNCLQPQKP